MKRRITYIVAGTLAAVAAVGVAQVVPPFFSAAATAFEPTVGVVQSGVVEDVQAVVSPDRKYVTLNMQPQNTNLLALRSFTFQRAAPIGVVGLPIAAAGGLRAASVGPGNWEPMNTSPSQIKLVAESWLLERQGMYRVASAP